MKQEFDNRADRGNVSWLKDVLTPEAVQKEGLLAYCGAEFEFPTCPAFCRGIREAADRGVFGFTLCAAPYTERVAWWMEHARGYRIREEWIVPTHGTIFSLATAIRLLTRPGESILVLTPGYNRYEQAAGRLGRNTKKIPLLCGWKEGKRTYRMDWDALEKHMADPENSLFVLCNPNNPTGTVFRQEELARIAGLSERYGVPVFCDEIFAEVTFGGRTVTPYTKAAGPSAKAISCTSLGKAFSLTGVNHANVLIENGGLREAYLSQRNADHYGSIDPILYAGLLAAYTREGLDWVKRMVSYVEENYRILESFLRKDLPRAVLTEPDGTYVAWVDYTGLGMPPDRLRSLLEGKGLFVGDGGEEYYGSDLCVRYSLAVPRKELERSLERLKRALRA